jgi:ATP-dependent protease Clp ATPase subunit
LTPKIYFFICGGAFDGITKIIERRVKSQSIGFNAQLVKNLPLKNIISCQPA